jgi:hypothetical protein
LAQLGAVAPPSLEGAMHALFFHDLQLVGHDDPEQITVRARRQFGPGRPYPGPVSTATDDEVELWTALSAAVRHPLPKSLLHDLLFLRRAGDVGAHAHDAIELYRQTARQPTVQPRYAHPTDGRSTIIEITEDGLAHQRLVWQTHQRTT